MFIFYEIYSPIQMIDYPNKNNMYLISHKCEIMMFFKQYQFLMILWQRKHI